FSSSLCFLSLHLPPCPLPSFPPRRSSDLSEPVGIGHFFDGFDSAVECDDKVHPVFLRIIDAEFRDAVPFRVPVGNVEKQLLHSQDRKSTRLNSSHVSISYAVFCLKKKKAT